MKWEKVTRIEYICWWINLILNIEFNLYKFVYEYMKKVCDIERVLKLWIINIIGIEDF